MSTLQMLLRDCALPQLEARMLMQHATGWSHASLISRGLDVLPDVQAELFQGLVNRRLSGEPIAYIVGVREFYGRDFNVNADVLIPRPDTETLIDWILNSDDLAADQALEVLDLGTGSGAIAITLACERPAWQVSAVDLSAAALQVAIANAERLDAHVNFFESDWFNALAETDPSPKFDLIVSNPPYVAADDVHLNQGDIRFEPRIALTDESDGLTNYAFLVQTAPRYLKIGGHLWFEHGYSQGLSVRKLLEAAGFERVRTIEDLAGNERISGGVSRRF